MNSPKMSFASKRSQSPKLLARGSSHVYAFTIPSHRTSTRFLASSWKGDPVCRPSVPIIAQKLRVATKRRKYFLASQTPDMTNADIPEANKPESREGDPQDVKKTQIVAASDRSTPIWLFVVESAIQVTILALAIAGSIHTRRRALTRLLALLSVPQVILIANRLWRRIKSSPAALSKSLSSDEEEEVVPESNSMEATPAREHDGRELTAVQSKMVSTGIRSAVAKEVSSLRYAIEQVEQTMEQRQQARNLAIAEAIASLDENLRGLRRSMDTRNQTEKSAPFALVSELEIMKSRLKQSEREKTELEVRLRAAEDNFEEAKRQGERARREADEATSKELGLQTELAIASSRLLRVDELTERLNRAERMNDKLQEKVINGTREQEGLRQSAEDAERRVVRVENIAQVLRDKVQELTGRPLPKFGKDDGDGSDETKEKADDQYWPQRLRGKGDLRPDSVVYQDLLREKKGSNSPLWPRDPLGIERERQEAGQRQMLPDDGGFGTGDAFSGNTDNDNGANKMLLSPEGGSDVMFSFSRGEFDKSRPKEAEAESIEQRDEPSQASEEESSQESGEEPSQESGEEPNNGKSLESKKRTSSTDESSEEHSLADDTVSSSPELKEGRIPDSAFPANENGQIKPAPFSEEVEQRDGEYVESGEANSKELMQSTEELQNANFPNDSALDTDTFVVRGQEGVSISDVGESSLVESPDNLKHDIADETSEQAEETPRESRVSLGVDSTPKESAPNQENQQPVPLSTGPAGSMQETSDQGDVALRDSSSAEDTEQPSTVVGSGDTGAQNGLQTGASSYLKSLSRNEEVKPVETTADLLQNARELVKKARVRGLAVKQADVLFAKATAKLERAMQELDDRTEAESDLGGCLLAWAKTNIADVQARNRLSRALEYLKSSCDSRPDDEAILFNTGLCLCLLASTGTEEQALEHYKMACDKYERLIQLNPNSRIACFNCGLAQVSLGRLSHKEGTESKQFFERAAVLFERSLELKPGDSKAISYLDDCKRQLADLS